MRHAGIKYHHNKQRNFCVSLWQMQKLICIYGWQQRQQQQSVTAANNNTISCNKNKNNNNKCLAKALQYAIALVNPCNPHISLPFWS